MNYYERHLGDYARDTGHLSLLEHGVYTLLLDRYYATEQGIPEGQAHRVARARSASENAAVDAVLAEFFTLTAGVWTNGRVEEELTKARVRIEAAKANGKKGGRKPKANPAGTQQEPNGFIPVKPNGTKEEPSDKLTIYPPNHHSEPNGSGADAPTDAAADPLWHTGLSFLIRKGVAEKPARSFLGKLKSALGDITAGALLAQAEAEDITDPVPWLQVHGRALGATDAKPVRLSAAERVRAHAIEGELADQRASAGANGHPHLVGPHG